MRVSDRFSFLLSSYSRTNGLTLKKLFIVFICGLVVTSAPSLVLAACEPVPSGIVSWWTGEGTAGDQEGTNDGALQGGATTSATGVVGSAFGFNGSTAYVQIPDSPSLRPSVFTIEAWVKFTSLNSTLSGSAPAGRQYIVFKQNTRSANFEGYNLYKDRFSNADYFMFGVSSAGGQVAEVQSTVSITTNVWYHLAGVRTATTVALYVNGQFQAQTSASFTQDYGNYPLYFGTSGQSYWDGKLAGQLDEVSLYDRALSAAEINAIYSAGSAGKCFGLWILSQPQSQTNILGGTAVFAVEGTGDPPISYQWLFNGEPIPGAIEPSLVLSGLQASNAGNYLAVLTNPNESVTSVVASLTVLLPPEFAAQPQGSTNLSGSTATFSTSVTGSAPMTYQWLFNGAVLTSGGRVAGAESTTLQIDNVVAADSGNYALVASNAAGSVTSSVAVLVVIEPPAILSQPADESAVAGGPAAFAVSADGTPPLAYRWYHDQIPLEDGENITGTTTSLLTLLSTHPPDAGGYAVVVSNMAGSVTSRVAALTVVIPPEFVLQPQNATNSPGTTAYFSAVASGTPPLTYRWLMNGTALGNGGRISGANSDTLQITSVEYTDGGNYSLVVSNAAGVVTSAVATLIIAGPPSILSHPVSTLVDFGEPALFEVSATGTPPLSYRWYRENTALLDGGTILGASTPVLSILAAQNNDAGGYFVVVTNMSGAVTSQLATLTINYAPKITTQPASQSVRITTNASFRVSVSGTPPFSFQWLFNGFPLADGGAVSGSTTSNLLLSYVLPANAGDYSVVVTNIAGSVTSAPAALTVNWAAECSSTPSGLVGWWPGDGSGRDIAGTNNGTLIGGSTATSNGVTGLAFDFDGTNKYVRIPDAPELKPTNLTVVCWVMFDNLDAPGTSVYVGQQYLVFKQNSRYSDFEGYVLSKDRTHDDIILWEVTSSSGQLIRIDSISPVTTNVWYHLAAVRGSNYISLYFNGQLEAEAEVNFPQDYGPQPVYFGTSGQAYYDRRLNGKLDEVMLFNRALSAEEISVLYASGPAGCCKGTNGIVVSAQPQSQTVTPGDTATFAVEAAGLSPLRYQWRFQGSSIIGATSSSITLTNIQAANQGLYQVLINDISGSVLSSAAQLIVSGGPEITTFRIQPDGHFDLTVEGTTGSVYAIEGSTNLLNWAEIERVTNFTGQADFTDPASAAEARKFYRARLVP